MTLDKVFSAEVRDVHTVNLVCKECGAIQGYNPARWNGNLTHSCPNCSQANTWSQDDRRKYVESLLTSLRELSKAESIPFEIRLQFKLPDTLRRLE